jgi:AFG3 family protein
MNDMFGMGKSNV